MDDLSPRESEPLINDNEEGTSIQDQHEERGSFVDYVSVGSILLLGLGERIAYYSVTANMILRLTSTVAATTMNLGFSGTMYFMPVFGGWIADALVGKYNTIFWSGIITLLGLLLQIIGASFYDKDHTVWIKTYSVSFVFIALGSGGLRSNILTLGAEKFEGKGSEAVRKYFNWSYWFVNFSIVIPYLGLIYLQDNSHWLWGSLIPYICLLISLFVFTVVESKYANTPVRGSPICDVIGVCWFSTCKRKSLDNFECKYSKETVDRVRAFSKLLPICGLHVIYWAVNVQSTTTFFLQSQRLRKEFKNMPVAMLNLFNALAVTLTVIIMEVVVFPYLKRRNCHLTLLKRLGIGMILATCAILSAGVLEFVRKNDITVRQNISDGCFNVSSLSVFYQIPQFVLMGASEVFTVIAGIEFAYLEAPHMMKGLCMGLFLETAGVGSMFVLVLIAIIANHSDWFPDEINNGHLEYIFVLLSIILFLNFCLFLYVASCYKYTRETNETVSNRFDESH